MCVFTPETRPLTTKHGLIKDTQRYPKAKIHGPRWKKYQRESGKKVTRNRDSRRSFEQKATPDWPRLAEKLSFASRFNIPNNYPTMLKASGATGGGTMSNELLDECQVKCIICLKTGNNNDGF